MALVQLSKFSGQTRTPISQYSDPDFLELHLDANQRIVQISWRRWMESAHRSTVDWTWTVWVETRL